MTLNKNVRKIKRLKLNSIFLIIFVFVFALCLFSKTIEKTSAQISGTPRFANILITNGDTVWDIAKTYYTELDGDINDYIKKICQANGLKNTEIHAGRYLIVPYYDITES